MSRKAYHQLPLMSLQGENPELTSGAMSPQERRLENCPWDVIEEIGSHLRQSDFARLSRTSRALYQMAQPLLWRHPRISDHGPLTLFTNFLNRPPVISVPRLEDWDRACWDRHMQVIWMTLRLDAGQGLNELASDLLQRIAKYCPRVSVTLLFNGKLDQRYLQEDPHCFFPKVTLLVMSRHGKSPNPKNVEIRGPIVARPGPPPSAIPDSEEHMAQTEQVVQEVAREITNEKNHKVLAETVHPYLSPVLTRWGGMRDCTVYAVCSGPPAQDTKLCKEVE